MCQRLCMARAWLGPERRCGRLRRAAHWCVWLGTVVLSDLDMRPCCGELWFVHGLLCPLLKVLFLQQPSQSSCSQRLTAGRKRVRYIKYQGFFLCRLSGSLSAVFSWLRLSKHLTPFWLQQIPPDLGISKTEIFLPVLERKASPVRTCLLTC